MPTNYETEVLTGRAPTQQKTPGYPHSFQAMESEESFIDIVKILRIVSRYIPGALAGIFLGMLLGAAAASLIPQTYSSSLLVEFIPSAMTKVLNPLPETGNNELGSGGKTAPMEEKKPIEPYLVLANSMGALELTEQKLKSQNLSLTGVSFFIRNIPSTNFLALEARSKNAKVTAAAVTAWKESIIEFLIKLTIENSQVGQTALNNHYQINKKALESNQQEMERLRANLELQREELRMKNQQLISYATQLEQLKPKLDEAKNMLPALSEEIKKHQPVRAITQSKANEFSPAYVINSNDNVKKGEINMVSYGANPIYETMEQKISDMELVLKTGPSQKIGLEKLYRQTLDEVVKLQNTIGENSARLASLERDQKIAQKEYDILYSTLGQTNLSSSLPISSLRSISSATPPSVVSKQRKYGIAGAFFGLLLSMPLQFWRRKRATA